MSFCVDFKVIDLSNNCETSSIVLCCFASKLIFLSMSSAHCSLPSTTVCTLCKCLFVLKSDDMLFD